MDAEGVKAQGAAPDDDVKKAEAALAHEDLSVIVEKANPATTEPSSDPTIAKQANGMWVDKDGNPTPHFNAAASSIASANSRFSLAFSSSSVFRRFASDTSRPPYLAFQLYRVPSEIPCLRQRSAGPLEKLL
jgi:hypothetical protein